MNPTLDMWIVYAPGTDGEPQYRARLWTMQYGTMTPTGETITAVDLSMVRAFIKQLGFDTCFVRDEKDPWNVVETWM